jgi:phosphocarrier protein HPr
MSPLDSPDSSPGDPASRGGAATRVLKIVNEKGLHARASAKFVGVVEKFKETAAIKVSRGDETVSGDSIMGLMMLGAGIGTSITVTASGPQAREAIDALDRLVATRFGEDE